MSGGRRTVRAMVTKGRTQYRCTECGASTPKWVGRCPECQAWSTMEEDAASSGPIVSLGSLGRRSPSARPMAVLPTSPALPVGQVPLDSARARPTGVGELDRVLGGGLVPGAVVLVAGEPGVGKSTLLLEVAAQVSGARGTPAARGPVARAGSRGDGPVPLPPGPRTVLYVSGEESTGQVRLRAERMGAISESLFLAADQDVATVLGHLDAVSPDLAIVDSVQTMLDPQVEGAAGGSAQVRAVTGALIGAAKARGLPVLLVGHVTKDGTIAGPRALEHLVDVVIQIEGDRHSPVRMVRSVKNRYGATEEVGCFELVEDGVRELPDPSGIFLSGRHTAVPGTCVTIGLEGRRPLPVEVQSLVTPGAGGSGRRTASGIDSQRLATTLAVLHAHVGLNLTTHDVYASTVGGARATEPAIDLALALAITGSARGTALGTKVTAFGEVGLAGEVRAVTGLRRRLQEAARLGFTDAIVPARGAREAGRVAGMRLHPAEDVIAAVRVGHQVLADRGAESRRPADGGRF